MLQWPAAPIHGPLAAFSHLPVMRPVAKPVAKAGHGQYSGREIPSGELSMSVDLATVKRVARLSRIAVTDEEAERMMGQLNGILGFVEQLSEVDVTGVEPMTSVTPITMRKRQDAVTDGDKADDVVANAPAADQNFFLVPKVVE
jgi:aspartyl-tRNA(Asn)/glutamyl-tRNA(Gln) amidotransferase subunit C